jgi:hypothetical protein
VIEGLVNTVDNPYSGQEPYATAWDHGYQYGSQNPNDTDPTPPDFSSWGLDDETKGYVEQVWKEGALAGRESGGGQSGGDGGQSGLPHYDAESDTLYADAEEFPSLVFLAQCGDVDSWLNQLGIDPSQFTDEPVA